MTRMLRALSTGLLAEAVLALLLAPAQHRGAQYRMPLSSVVLPATLGAQDDQAKSSDDEQDEQDGDYEDDTPPPDPSRTKLIEIQRMYSAARDSGTPLHVDVAYGTGDLRLSPADGPWLYDVTYRYLSSSHTPSVKFDPRTHRLAVRSGNDNTDISFGSGNRHSSSGNELRFALSRRVPLDLSVSFGAGSASAELGGMSLHSLEIQTGASGGRISFGQPNRIPMENFDVAAGAAQLSVVGLGNARARHIHVQAGAGKVELDMGGAWDADATLDVTAALGSVIIHVPTNVAVDAGGMTHTIIGATVINTGEAVPDTPGGPIYHLHVKSTTTLGDFEIDRRVSH